MIVGAENEGFVIARVQITHIDGSTEMADWRAPAFKAHLEPGRHEIGVMREFDTQPLLVGAVPLAAAAVANSGSMNTARTLVLDLQPGNAYAIYLEGKPLQYFVSRFPNVWPLKSERAAPPDAVACTPIDAEATGKQTPQDREAWLEHEREVGGDDLTSVPRLECSFPARKAAN